MTKPGMRKVYRLFYFLNTDILPDIQDPNFIFAQVIRYHSEQVAQTVESVLQFLACVWSELEKILLF